MVTGQILKILTSLDFKELTDRLGFEDFEELRAGRSAKCSYSIVTMMVTENHDFRRDQAGGRVKMGTANRKGRGRGSLEALHGFPRNCASSYFTIG